ncbi:MAG TPA: hypothetical protein PK095_14975, partial [Myxococcota bacterium]|nr:hypothetical protein [Myxococcota bacterium]
MCPRLRSEPSYDATPDRITGQHGHDPADNPREHVALTVAWSLSSPDRVGELVLFDDAEPRLIGRGPEAGVASHRQAVGFMRAVL